MGVCSLLVNPELVPDIVRNHWATENDLHGDLDVNFGQDGIQAKNLYCLANRVTPNKLALSLVEELQALNSGICKEMSPSRLLCKRLLTLRWQCSV